MAKNIAFDLTAMAAAINAMQQVQQAAGDAINRIAEADAKLVDAKNVADDAKTAGTHLWKDVFQVASATFTATVDCPADREMVLHAVLKPFLEVEKGAKLSTAGQYASTAKKLLAHVTKNREDIIEYADKNRREILDAMRDKSHAELLEKVKDAAKEARFIVKHGDTEARKLLADMLGSITVIYGPIKARKESEKAATVGSKELADLRQRHPTAPMVTETVAADIVADDVTGDKAGEKIAMLEELHAQKHAVA